MKLAVSNIAWDQSLDAKALELLQKYQISRLEIAPAKKWTHPAHVSKPEAVAYKNEMSKLGFDLVAMQSLVYNRPDLTLFTTKVQRRALLDYLRQLIQLSSWLEIPVMVFGAPKNRKRGNLSQAEAAGIAQLFFKTLGDYAADHGVCFCIEANSTFYECDFITNTEEAYKLVQQVNSPGFGLHLDLGNMILSGEDYTALIKKYFLLAKHFHLSVPDLKPLDSLPNLQKALASLKLFPHVVSVEMRSTNHSLTDLENSLHCLRSYCQQI